MSGKTFTVKWVAQQKGDRTRSVTIKGTRLEKGDEISGLSQRQVDSLKESFPRLRFEVKENTSTGSGSGGSQSSGSGKSGEKTTEGGKD